MELFGWGVWSLLYVSIFFFCVYDMLIDFYRYEDVMYDIMVNYFDYLFKFFCEMEVFLGFIVSKIGFVSCC